MQRLIRVLSAALAVVLSWSFASAGPASHWAQSTEADFKAGTFSSVVATNLGDLKLSRAVQTVLEQDPKVSAVYALVEAPNKTIYAGTGPQGLLLQVKDGKVSTLATLENGTSIFSLLIDQQGRLLIGTGGERGCVLRLDKAGEKPQEIFAAEGVQYIWAMQQTPDGRVYLATGPNGQIYQLDPDGKAKTLFKSDNEHNILCLLSDGKDTLYAGTDPNGLVYRINRQSGQGFVLHDTAESEVSALALDRQGNLYAATAGAGDQLPSASDKRGSEESVGRPEGDASGAPIPAEPPANPTPPEVPDPSGPDQPPRIPRTPNSLLVLPAAGEPDADGALVGDGDPSADGDRATPGRSAAAAEAARAARSAAGRAITREPAKPTGNAVYRIDRDGFVTEIFREPVLVLSMIERNGLLLLGTGNEGLVYQVDPAAQETSVLAKVDPKQVLCLMSASDGRVYMGLANVGGIAAMSGGFAAQGTFTSPVLDASQISRFGKIRLEGTLPTGTSLKVSTRSGNLREPTDASWSRWSDQVPATAYVPVASPAARFLQYRLTFASSDGNRTPVVDEVDVAYQMPNLPPEIASIRIGSGARARAGGGGAAAAAAAAAAARREAPSRGERTNPGGAAGSSGAATPVPEASPSQTIAWEASDPNSDGLEYSLYFRPADSDAPWVLLKDELKETELEWDTRGVGDGRYQVRVVASDTAANPLGQGRTSNRVSDPLIVDNTPPVIGDLKWQQEPRGLRIDLRVADRTSAIAALEYSVDSVGDWQAVEPSDNIADSPEERYGFVIPNLKPGPHQVAIRATDVRGNQTIVNVLFTLGEPQQQGPQKDAKKD